MGGWLRACVRVCVCVCVCVCACVCVRVRHDHVRVIFADSACRNAITKDLEISVASDL